VANVSSSSTNHNGAATKHTSAVTFAPTAEQARGTSSNADTNPPCVAHERRAVDAITNRQ
jgi:hypothetical protein